MPHPQSTSDVPPAPTFTEARPRHDWREPLLQALLVGLGTVSLPILVNEVLYRDDWLAPALSWCLLPALWLSRERMPYAWRAGAYVTMVLLLGAWAAATAGLMGSGRIFMGVSVIVGGLLFGRGVGIALFALGCGFTGLVGYGAVTGYLTFAPPFDGAANTAALWISHVGTFVIGVGGLLLAVLYVIETREALHGDLRREINERESVERAEREAASHIRFLAANAGDTFWTMDLDFRFTYVSESVTRMRGFTPEEIMATGVEGALAADSADDLRALLANALARDGGTESDEHLRLETRLTTRDGAGVDVEINVGLLRDAAGRPIGVMGVTRDVSDRRRLEAAMDSVIRGTRRTGDRDFFDALTENLAEVLGVRIVFLARLTDPERMQCVSAYRDGVHVEQDDYAIAGTPCEVVLREGVCNCRSGAGERFPEAGSLVASGIDSVVGVPLLDDEGQRVGVLLCMDDAPSQDPRQTEDLLTIFSAHASLELSRRQAEVEREAIQGQLQQVQKLESIGQLSGGIAHDFNNLLVVIHGYAELAETSQDDPETLADSLLNIRAATERAAALTRQLLSFSRRQVMDTRALDLGEQLESVGAMLRRLLPETIDYELRVEGPLTVDADPGQLEQAVINLAVNARDAMPEGGRLAISAQPVEVPASLREKHPDARPGPYALLRVADSGEGIAALDLAQIFEPFFTTKADGRGTGLGLSVVFGVVRQHGGFIEVDSRPGEGSEFRLYLPRLEGPAESVAREPERPPVQGRETILLVEDEPAVRSLATRFLTRAGYRVVEADDGESAIEQFLAHRDDIALAVLDVVLPKTNGRRVMEEITAIEPKLRVLFVSGYAAGGIHADFILEKDLVLLPKPYSRDQLLGKVREVLDAVPVASAGSRSPRPLTASD